MRRCLRSVGCLILGFAFATIARADASLSVDFAAKTDEPPLSKSLIGVYQTPFWFKAHPPDGEDAKRMVALLREAGVRDFRYELAWGKPDAFDDEGGALDPFLKQLADAKIATLLALTYCPRSLQRGPPGWQRWKDEPANLALWSDVCRNEAIHDARELKLPNVAFEVWNEPDMPGDGGKMFFNGDAAAYGRVYAAAARGVRAGAGPTTPVGGPAIAYDTSFLAASGVLDQPIDFVSIHAYANAPEQLARVRAILKGRHLPIRLTEYASYSDAALAGSADHFASASRFFSDVKTFLAEPDLAKVYWAQWADDSSGMLSDDLHRRALFNAYAMYQTLLPTTRRPVRWTDAVDLDALAAADGDARAVVIWNTGDADRPITVALLGLGAKNEAKLFRIDAHHASHGDDPTTESLTVDERWSIDAATGTWHGTVPAGGVALIRIDPASTPR